MKARLLSTVAASLLLTVGVASAQSPKEQQAPARAPAAQQSAPAEKVAPPMKADEKKPSETTGQATKESKPDSMSKTPETSGQSPKAADKEKAGNGMKNSSDTKAPDASKSTSDTKSPAMKSTTDTNKADTTKGATDTTKSPTNAQGATDTKSSTSGQGAAAGAAKLTTEQRTKITSVIKSQKVDHISRAQLNISLNVGTRIPTTVRVHTLPAEVVTIYPEWRGYDYILVDEEIVILDPRTHEIVFIIT